MPTAREQGLNGLASEHWLGVLAPAHTSPAIIGKRNRDIVEFLRTPDIKTALLALGAGPSPSPPTVTRQPGAIRTITLSMVNSDFRQVSSDSTIRFEEPVEGPLIK